jgi:hypothetical protein
MPQRSACCLLLVWFLLTVLCISPIYHLILLVVYLPYSSTPTMVAVLSPGIYVNCHQTTWHYNPRIKYPSLFCVFLAGNSRVIPRGPACGQPVSKRSMCGGWLRIHLICQLLGLLHQTCTVKIYMSVKQSMKWWIDRGTKVLKENLPQCYFVHHSFHMNWPGSNMACCSGKPRD